MKFRIFGNTGIRVPIIGQGTWQIEIDPQNAINALRAGLDAGMSHIDTAESYANGLVEELVSKAIHGRRQEVFLVSKVHPDNASYRKTLRACEKSLKRLRTDYLDAYLLHWRGSYPLEETLHAFEDLERVGKIRAFGVSNFGAEDLDTVERLIGPNRIACNQVLYNLGVRNLESMIPRCKKGRIGFVGYSPLGTGLFPGRETIAGRILFDIAALRNLKPRQIALSFLTHHSNSFTLAKSTNIQHVGQNAAAGSISLSKREMELLRATFPINHGATGHTESQ